MSIEFQLNTVTIKNEDIEENYPFIFSALNNYLPTHKPKRRISRKKRTRASALIDNILESIKTK